MEPAFQGNSQKGPEGLRKNEKSQESLFCAKDRILFLLASDFLLIIFLELLQKALLLIVKTQGVWDYGAGKIAFCLKMYQNEFFSDLFFFNF